ERVDRFVHDALHLGGLQEDRHHVDLVLSAVYLEDDLVIDEIVGNADSEETAVSHHFGALGVTDGLDDQAAWIRGALPPRIALEAAQDGAAELEIARFGRGGSGPERGHGQNEKSGRKDRMKSRESHQLTFLSE